MKPMSKEREIPKSTLDTVLSKASKVQKPLKDGIITQEREISKSSQDNTQSKEDKVQNSLKAIVMTQESEIPKSAQDNIQSMEGEVQNPLKDGVMTQEGEIQNSLKDGVMTQEGEIPDSSQDNIQSMEGDTSKSSENTTQPKGIVIDTISLDDDMVRVITGKEDFEETLKEAGEKLVAVDFSAVWCGPCRTIRPHFHSLSLRYDDVVFLEVDADDCEQLVQDLNILTLPTFQFYKKEEKVGEFSGALLEQLEASIAELK
ncbi:thioredoxin domain-containing protein 2 isoform X3 [Meriones unguiculatus]|uniref:thioredoxin domain-containing protein 2 isoform X3 n=1 Tax=Meriones unguiculatus TaxID=10047 RepID=UPI00293E4F52|nr:thioredoxin domain-containing protein 2 isoform X3 [Meriones unguiculatus]